MPVSHCRMCAAPEYKDVFAEGGVLVRRCLACRHVYSSYEQDERYDGYWDEIGAEEIDPVYWDHAHRRIYAQFTDRHLEPERPGRIVDVGAGLGYFVDHVRRHRPGWEVSGYELSPRAVEHAHTVLGLGDAVHQGAVEDADLAPGSVDIITLWDVLEHLPEPLPLLRHLRSLLRPGGFVFVQTPSANFQLTRAWTEVIVRDRGVIPGRQYLAPADHVNLYTRATLRRLVEQAGFAPPVFDVMRPIAAVEGSTHATAVRAKEALYHVTRGVFAATGGRALLNPTLFARLAHPGDG
jgi:2-polyprenyl-3-methyl-5-hydroxy-6-metoxy-1,4-benzoquinol methylase